MSSSSEPSWSRSRSRSRPCRCPSERTSGLLPGRRRRRGRRGEPTPERGPPRRRGGRARLRRPVLLRLELGVVAHHELLGSSGPGARLQGHVRVVVELAVLVARPNMRAPPAPRGPSRAPTSGGARSSWRRGGRGEGGGGLGAGARTGRAARRRGERRDDATRRATTRRDDARRRGGCGANATRDARRDLCVSRTRAGAHHPGRARYSTRLHPAHAVVRRSSADARPQHVSAEGLRCSATLPRLDPRALSRHRSRAASRPVHARSRSSPARSSDPSRAARRAARRPRALPRDASPAPRALLPAPPRPSCPPAARSRGRAGRRLGRGLPRRHGAETARRGPRSRACRARSRAHHLERAACWCG